MIITSATSQNWGKKTLSRTGLETNALSKEHPAHDEAAPPKLDWTELNFSDKKY